MPHRFITSFSPGRRAIVVFAALVALAAFAPLANAAGSRSLACQASPAHWVSVTDEQGVPSLELVAGTTCTTAVTTIDGCASQRSPYPGWVQVTDEIGVPTLYKIGFEPSTSTPCSETLVQSTSVQQAAAPSPQFGWPPMKSPYAGWVVVFDAQGVPNLEQISQYR